MTNQQLYLSIGIPTFTVILALLISLFQNNRWSEKMGRLFEQHPSEFRAEMNQLRPKVTSDRKNFPAETIALRREIHGDMVKLHERVKAVEVGVDARQDNAAA